MVNVHVTKEAHKGEVTCQEHRARAEAIVWAQALLMPEPPLSMAVVCSLPDTK